MADMSEVAASINQLLDPTVNGDLHNLVHAALEHAAAVQQVFGTVVEGSDNTHVREISERLAAITQTLGDMAASLVMIEGSRVALLNDWGVGGFTPTAGAGCLAVVGYEAPPPPAAPDYLTNAVQTRLNRSLATVFKEDLRFSDRKPKVVGSYMAGELADQGVATAGDVLLIGRERLSEYSRMGESRMRLLSEGLATAYPDVPFLPRPDAAFAARLRPSLAQVPWHCLVEWPTTWGGGIGFRERACSIQDVLTLPRERLLGGLDEGQYRRLYEKAQRFAQDFEAAKREAVTNAR